MHNKIRNSVAIAAFNGEKHLREQIDSILQNLSDHDEIVISDDGSTDNTLNIIQEYMDKDSRVRLVNGPKQGIIANFENAVKNANGKYIFLSDQDDIWTSDKVREVLQCFEDHNCTCVVHDAQAVNENMDIIIPSFFKHRNSAPGIMHNLIKNSYIGCCMAFDRILLDKILPIPKNINMHDQWIGSISDKFGKTVFLNKILMSYRRHGNNASSLTHYPLFKMIKIRVVMAYEIIKRK